MVRIALALLCTLASAPAARAQTAQPWAVRDVRVSAREDAPRVTLLLSGGRIERVLDAADAVPPGYRIHEGAGRLCVPAFVDAYTHAGCEAPEPVVDRDLPTDTGADVDVDMRRANRKGVRLAFRAADVLALEDKQRESWRESGFGALLSAPRGELLAGASVLATTGEAAARDAIVRPEVFVHAAFASSGGGYPSTLMGHAAQLRQFFLDARRHNELVQRWAAGRPGPRPPYDRDLDAALPLLAGDRRVVCEAESENDLRRWLALGAEAGFDVAFSGGREAWKVADVLAARRTPLFLTLDWGEEPDDPHEKDAKEAEPAEEGEPPPDAAPDGTSSDAPAPTTADASEIDWIYEEPLGVREERRRLWEEDRACAVRLHEAGVRFAFGTGGDGPRDLLKRVRELVEHGLDRDVALRALTRDAAELVGAGDRLGSLAPGFDASLGIWTDHPLAKKARLACLFVDGVPYEQDLDEEPEDTTPPAEGTDVTGTWTLVFERGGGGGDVEGQAVLEMDEDGAVTGTVRRPSFRGEESVGEFEGRLAGTELRLRGSWTMGDFEVDVTLRAEVRGDELEGKSTVRFPGGERTSDFRGTRVPEETR